MEINTTYPNQATLASQTAARDRKVSGIDEPAESKKQNTPGSEADKTEQVGGDTVSLSLESVKLAQSASVSSIDKPSSRVNREQVQQLVGQLVSDIHSNPRQAQNAYGNRSGVNVGSLLS